MDPISIAFYAVVCALLGAIAPNIGGLVPRLAAGALVGILAAAALPFLRGLAGL